jgi:hypothetical protein
MIPILAFAAFILGLIYWLIRRRRSPKGTELTREIVMKKVKKKYVTTKKQKFKASKQVPSHARYSNAFKGFEAPVVDFDVKSGVCGAVCEDGTVKLFEFSNTTEDFRFTRAKLETDRPSAVAVSSRG